MDLPVRRVAALDCPSCGHPLDPKAYKPLSAVQCPQCGESINVPAQFDAYRLIRRLGHGGSGVVMEAFDEKLFRRVAIKVLFSGGDADKVALEATREARALARINHPGIVPIHKLGEAEGHKFIVMELLDGGSARDFASPPSRMSERDALELGIGMAEALEAAHRVGLVHMDVKPGNILFNDRREPKLIDFGAAQHARMRKEKGVVGTPYYIAPEVARGAVPDAKADIYSLGASIFHVLTGSPPFDAEDARGVIMKRLVEPAPDARSLRSDIQPATAELLARMLATKPNDRYADYPAVLADMRAARAALDQPLGGIDTDAIAGGRRAAIAAGARRKTKTAWLGPAVVVVVMAVFAGGLLVLLGGDSSAPPPDETQPVIDPIGKNADPQPADAPPPGAGRLVRELWIGVPGKELAIATDAALRQRKPTSITYVDSLALTRDGGDDYVQRVHGYVFAPQTGDYRFFLSADDAAVLRIAPGGEGTPMRDVARVETLIGPTEFTLPSEPFALRAGTLYPIEVIHKEHTSLDHLIVGWVLPDGTRQTPIESKWLVPPAAGLLAYTRWSDVPADANAETAIGVLAAREPTEAALVSSVDRTGTAQTGRQAQRVRGRMRLPASGKYTFELIAADEAVLRLRRAGKAAAAETIIKVDAPGTPAAWNKAVGKPIVIEGGEAYDFELVHIGAGPESFFRVGLVHPDGFVERPISPDYFSPHSD